MHRSRSQRGYVYYFNEFTGKCQWETPFQVVPPSVDINDDVVPPQLTTGLTAKLDSLIGLDLKPILKRSPLPASSTTPSNLNTLTSPKVKKPRLATTPTNTNDTTDENKKERRRSSSATATTTATSSALEQVRVLHILKKHKKSRRPSSWRSTSITISRSEAVAELEEVRSILQESEDDPKELRATFEELAREQSDCSSARKGGDLGYFGRKQMKPAFEKVSFGLRVGQLSGILDTSSGVHVILRLG